MTTQTTAAESTQATPRPGYLYLYPTENKRKANKICRRLAEGVAACGDAAEILPNNRIKHLKEGPAFFYGMDPYTLPLIREAEEIDGDWYYADNAYYFGRGSHFRITRGALMHDGVGDANPDRFRAFGLELHPWKRNGRYVLLTTQSALFYDFRMGMTREEWIRQTVAKIRQYTDREIKVCIKPEPHRMREDQPHADDFETLLRRAWVVVTHSSSTGVGAILAGVPVVSTAPSMCSAVATPLEFIEDPHYPDDREQWLANLADNQWTYEEMVDGTAWKALRTRPRPWAGRRTLDGVPLS